MLVVNTQGETQSGIPIDVPNQDLIFDDIKGFIDVVKGIFGSLNPGCWGAKAYGKGDVETQVNVIYGFYNQIASNPNNLSPASSLFYLANFQEKVLTYDLTKLVNTCSKENASKLLQIYRELRAFLMTVYDYYEVPKSEAGHSFITQIPTRLKPDAPPIPATVPQGNTNTGGSNTPQGNTQTGGTTTNGSGNGSSTPITDSPYYRTVTTKNCGNVRIDINGQVTDMQGNLLDFAACQNSQSPTNGTASNVDWNGTIDWGTGGISVGSGSGVNNNMLLMMGGLVGLFFLMNKKKK